MDYVKNILAVAKANNYTDKQLCELLGKNTSYVSDWKNGKSKPKADEIILLTKEFNVTADYLLGLSDTIGESPVLKMDKPQNEGVELYLSLDETDQAELRGQMRYMLRSEKYRKDSTNLA